MQKWSFVVHINDRAARPSWQSVDCLLYFENRKLQYCILIHIMAYFDLLEGICYFIWIYVSQPAIVGVFEVKVHVPFSQIKEASHVSNWTSNSEEDKWPLTSALCTTVWKPWVDFICSGVCIPLWLFIGNSFVSVFGVKHSFYL